MTDRLTVWLTDWLTVRQTDWLVNWLIGWLDDQLTDWLPGWQTDWLTGWLIGWLTGWLIGWLADQLTDWLTDWLTGWLIGWLTDWLTDWQARWQAGWLINWIYNIVSYWESDKLTYSEMLNDYRPNLPVHALGFLIDLLPFHLPISVSKDQHCFSLLGWSVKLKRAIIDKKKCACLFQFKGKCVPLYHLIQMHHLNTASLGLLWK